MAAIPCSAFTSATSTLCNNCEEKNQKMTHQHVFEHKPSSPQNPQRTRLGAHLNIAHGVSLLVEMFAVGNHLLYLSALEKVQLQQLRNVLAEIDGVQHAQQLPAH